MVQKVPSKGAFKNHITQILPFVDPPTSLNYHFQVNPPSHYHSLSLSSRYVSSHLMRVLWVLFFILVFFTYIFYIWSDITYCPIPPSPPYHSIISLGAIPPYRWVIRFLNAPQLTVAMILVTVTLSDHLPKHVRDFAAGGGNSLLWPRATTFLNNREPISGRMSPRLLVAEGQKDL